MKFRVERDALADAVTWAARSLASRPTLPVLAGLLLQVEGDRLSVSGFDLEASTQVDLEVFVPKPDAPILGQAPLGYIEPTHDLDTRGHRARNAARVGSVTASVSSSARTVPAG